MKKLLFLLATIMSFMTIASCTDNKSKGTADPFADIIAQLDDSSLYAVVDIDSVPTLFVTHGFYEISQPKGESIKATICANAYCVGADGAVDSLGEFRTQGTAYPLSVADGKLILAGHHFVGKVGYAGNPRRLTQVSGAYEHFDTLGNATYTYDDQPHNIHDKSCDKNLYDSLYAVALNCNIIEFHK